MLCTRVPNGFSWTRDHRAATLWKKLRGRAPTELENKVGEAAGPVYSFGRAMARELNHKRREWVFDSVGARKPSSKKSQTRLRGSCETGADAPKKRMHSNFQIIWRAVRLIVISQADSGKPLATIV